MKNKIPIFLLLLCSAGFTLKAQDAVTEVFSKSYAFEKAGNYTGAIVAMKSIYNEKSYEINLRLGYLHYMAGLYADGMTYYQRAIVLKPEAVEARLGYVYPASVAGKWDDVVRQYQAILKIDPKNSNINYKLGLIQYNRKNYLLAYKHFEVVVSLYPFDYDGLLMFAWSNLQLGKMKEAKGLFQRVLLLSPADKSAKEGLALIK